MSFDPTEPSTSAPSTSEGLDLSLTALISSLQLLKDDTVLANPQVLRDHIALIRAHAKGFEEAYSELAPPRRSESRLRSHGHTAEINRPDPQVLRAIDDIRTLRAESVQERRGRIAAEASLHREVVETIRKLLGLLERRWPDRVITSRAAARLAKHLADAAGLTPVDARGTQVAALLQDVGLLALPDRLLRSSPVGLPAEERQLYQQHPEIAAETLGGGEFAEMGGWIRSHHERWDGTGYPDGLRGEEIPMPVRVIAVSTGYAEAASREGATAAMWRREQMVSGAYDPSLLRMLDRAIHDRFV